MDNGVIVLSATLNAQACMGMALKDIETRRENYLTALKKFLSFGLRTVFVENTLGDMSFIRRDIGYPDNLEVLTFDGNHFVHQYGKGQGENESITYALENSAFLRRERFFFKVSGRYFSSQIKEAIAAFDSNAFDGMFEMIPSIHGNGHVLTVFFGLDKNYYLEHVSCAPINDSTGLILERVMRVSIEGLRIKWIEPIRYDPTILGGSGQIVTVFPA